MCVYMQEYVYYAQALVLAGLCLQRYLVCCVMVGVCLAAVSWQSKNGLLVTLPPFQRVAVLRLHHIHLPPPVAQLGCLMVEMRLAVASWQSKTCLLRYSPLQTANFDKDVLRGGTAVLEWAVSFQTSLHTVPGPDQPCIIPDSLPGEQVVGSDIALRVGYGSLQSTP